MNEFKQKHFNNDKFMKLSLQAAKSKRLHAMIYTDKSKSLERKEHK